MTWKAAPGDPLADRLTENGAVLLACALGLGVCGWLLSGLSKRDSDGELEDILVLEVGGESTPLSSSLRLKSDSPTITPAIELQQPNSRTTPHLAA